MFPSVPSADNDASAPGLDWSAAYPELKKIARARLYSAGPDAGLNTTALVNESYLRLVGHMDRLDFRTRGHFYAYAAQTMRSVIVDLVRERQAERRGGDAPHVTLGAASDLAHPQDDEALHVDAALTALSAVEPRLAQVVELRYFMGLTDDEIANVLGLTDRTVRRDWEKARALLQTMLSA